MVEAPTARARTAPLDEPSSTRTLGSLEPLERDSPMACATHGLPSSDAGLWYDSHDRLHQRVMKVAPIAECAQLIRGPHKLFGLSNRTGVAPWTARYSVIVEADVVPADDDSRLDSDHRVRVAEWLLLEEVVASVDLLYRLVR